MMRPGADVCAVYIGDPTGSPDRLAGHGTIALTLAVKMLELTAPTMASSGDDSQIRHHQRRVRQSHPRIPSMRRA